MTYELPFFIIIRMKVYLIGMTQNPVRAIFIAARNCYTAKSVGEVLLEFEQKPDYVLKLLTNLYKKGHHSIFEHASFTFIAEDLSRTATHQLVRHRIASYSQQSQRYSALETKPLNFVIPDTLKEHKEVMNLLSDAENLYKQLIAQGVPREDARFILPQAITSRIVFTMNLRELFHFWKLRTNPAAQWEIRKLAKTTYSIVKQTDNLLKKFLQNTIEPEIFT